MPVAAPLGLSTRYLFFTGKGGVGKTTLACAVALALADAGRRVLIVSTDPASNLDEMLGTRLGAEPSAAPGAVGLFAANIDPEQAADDYRARVLAPYIGAVSDDQLARMREELAGACTIEIAAFDRFAGLLAGDGSGFDHVVFDTAPTGHTLRLLELPRAWTSFLDENTRGASCLGPHGGLTTRHDRFMEARRALDDAERTTVVLVTRPETSALREAGRTSAELRTIGLVNQRLVVNGVFRATIPDDGVAAALEARGRAALAQMPPALAVLPRIDVPLRPYEMVGLEALRALLHEGDPPRPEATSHATPPEPPSLASLIDEIARKPQGLVMVMGKGGVGKTTIACAIAVAMADRGIDVLLSTTDPAAHVVATVDGQLPRLEVARIDPAVETKAYIESILASKGKDLDDEGRELLLEDLRSPCTEEVAVFHAFSRTVARARQTLVVLDTAPTGHTLLLLDATGSYHREMLRKIDRTFVHRVTTPLMRLRDPAYTKILLATLPETTPVSEASRLQDDLRRAGIEPWAWVVNASLAASQTRDPLLARRVAIELGQIERVRALAQRLAVVPWLASEPRGAAALRALVR
jgi:arsenite-transporting ATPase